MNEMTHRFVPDEAFKARPITADPKLIEAYFAQVASYEADRLGSYRRMSRFGFGIGIVGLLVGLAGVGAAASMAPLKTVIPLVFRVDNSTGAVERVYDVRAAKLSATDASKRYFLWQYVRYREGYAEPEAQSNFDAVSLMSSPDVQRQYNEGFRGSNASSPQVTIGKAGSQNLRWVSTSFLGEKLAQVRFDVIVRKGDAALPPKRMVATIAFDFAPGELSSQAINVNPTGFIVTSYHADNEVVR